MSRPELDTVNQGDCIAGMRQLEAGSVDLAFADPPFNIGYSYDEYDDRKDRERYLAWSRDWMAAVYRVLKPTGSFWLAIGDEYAAELKLIAQNDYPTLPLNPAKMETCAAGAAAASDAAAQKDGKAARRRGRRPAATESGRETGGFHCRSWVIWYYTFGVHCERKFTRSHAHLFHFVKDPKAFTFNSDEVRVPSARQLVYADKRANPRGRMPDDTWIIAASQAEALPPDEDTAQGSAKANSRNGHRPPAAARTHNGFVLRPQDLPDGFTSDSSMWYFSRVAGTFNEREGWHGCQMPEQLLGRIIRFSSNPGEIVLDPFGGSGTTLVVAKKLGRTPIGFELSKQYAEHGRKRLAAVKPGDALDGVENPLTSAPRTADGRTREGMKESAKRRGQRPRVVSAGPSMFAE